MFNSVHLSSLLFMCAAGRLYAMQTGMKLDSKTPECRKFLVKLMDQLETVSLTSSTSVHFLLVWTPTVPRRCEEKKILHRSKHYFSTSLTQK